MKRCSAYKRNRLVGKSGQYLNLPTGRPEPSMPEEEWRRTIHDLHNRLIGTLRHPRVG